MAVRAAPTPRAVASVDLSAITANCERLRRALDSAELCAVVKADGYGHGIVESAQAAVAGGASWLAVVTGEEALTLREAGLDQRLLVMAPLRPGELCDAIGIGAELTAWRPDQVREIGAAAAALGSAAPLHIKLDTGMGRFGARDPRDALACIELALATEGVVPVAVWTHFATADEPESAYFDLQLARFSEFVEQARAIEPTLMAHAANSAACLRDRASQFDMVRCGIAIYGLDPLHEDASAHDLRPALSLSSYVAELRPFAPGDSAGYGRRFVADRATWLATVPIGYGDGWRRHLSGAADALIGGRRYPQVGTVSMDSITVDAGPDPRFEIGEAVTLIGAQGGERITTEEVARRCGTINYEITCGLARRVRREYTAHPGPAGRGAGSAGHEAVPRS